MLIVVRNIMGIHTMLSIIRKRLIIAKPQVSIPPVLPTLTYPQRSDAQPARGRVKTYRPMRHKLSREASSGDMRCKILDKYVP
jgi:hypothetical protein